MKKRILTVISVIFIVFMFITVAVLTATDAPDEAVIENEGYKNDKKGGVKLSHKKHNTDYGVACTECHHEYKDGKNIWQEGAPVKKCVGCHDPEKKQGNADKLQTAFHTNCKDCHKEKEKAGKKNAPYKKCSDCHAK